MNSNVIGHHRETISHAPAVTGKPAFHEHRHTMMRKSTRAHEEWVKLNHLNGTRPFSAWSRHRKHDPL